jgi:hypothetical protein
MKIFTVLAMLSLLVHTVSAQTGGVSGGSPSIRKCGKAYVDYNSQKDQLEVRAGNLFMVQSESRIVNLNLEFRIPGRKMAEPQFILLMFVCQDDAANFAARQAITFRVGEKSFSYRLAQEQLKDEAKSRKFGMLSYWIPFQDFREIVGSPKVVMELIGRNLEVSAQHLAVLRELAQAPTRCQ